MGRSIGCAHPREFLRSELPGRHGVIDDLSLALALHAGHAFLLHCEEGHARPDTDERSRDFIGVRHDPTHVELPEDDEDQEIQDERGPRQAP